MLNLDYPELYKLSISQPEKVWHELAQEVIWDEQYTEVLQEKQSPISKWFVGGKINMSYNCLDRHVKDGYGNKLAIIHESPSSPNAGKITYKELLNEVELLAGVLVDKCHIGSGDRVLLYFPVIPQCMIGILACTRIGATYSVVYGGFSYGAIAAKIDHIEPHLILTCNIGYNNGIIENYKECVDNAITESKYKPRNCIIYNRPGTPSSPLIENRDLDWIHEMKEARHHGHVSLDSNHPMLLIYSSGTTGEPKGMVNGTGNIVVSDKSIMKYQLGMRSDEVAWFISDFAWLTGQLLTTYGMLLNRGTSILYEGYPSDTTIIEVLQRHRPAIFFSSPMGMRNLRKNLNKFRFPEKFDNLRSIFIGGNLPVALVVKNDDTKSSDEEIIQQTVDLVHNHMGKFILFQKVVIVPSLLETKSGKISRYFLMAMINGKDYVMSPMIKNPDDYRLIYNVLIKQGFNATLPR